MTQPPEQPTPEREPLPRVLEAALHAFAEHGYHGTSIRDLAAAAGLSVPGLYHHHRSKQDVLVALMTAVQSDLVERVERARDEAPDDPVARFDAVVRVLLAFHIERRTEAFVASTEIRSLEPEHRTAYVASRDRVQRVLDEAVEAGCAAGVMATPVAKEASRAVSVLAIGLAGWYRTSGPLEPAELVERHLVLARALVGLPPS
ncbi:MAG: TetR family transcriptional regulator [Nocardioides sp.]|nr:TetR family transcriptional regulator [Nocardioides sp.]